MQQFQVPQFIEVEDKIFGPLTTKQFFYLLGGGGLCFLLWFTFKSFLAIFLIIPIAALALALAFLKINGRPFIYVMASFISYSLAPKRFLWQKVKKPITRAVEPGKPTPSMPKLTENKLSDLAWALDITEKVKR